LHVLSQFDHANHGLRQRLSFRFAEHPDGRWFFHRTVLGSMRHSEDNQRRGRLASEHTHHLGPMRECSLARAANCAGHVAQGRQERRPVTLPGLRQRLHLAKLVVRQIGLFLLEVTEGAAREQSQTRSAHGGMNAVDALRLGQIL
jgi:hypothetical protein